MDEQPNERTDERVIHVLNICSEKKRNLLNLFESRSLKGPIHRYSCRLAADFSGHHCARSSSLSKNLGMRVKAIVRSQ